MNQTASRTISLDDHLGELQASRAISGSLRHVLEITASACARISQLVQQGALGGVLGSAGSENVQGEVQKKLDIIANDTLIAAHQGGSVAAFASEEMDSIHPIPGSESCQWLLLFDPLDGSSNIDVNASIGTIFSVLPRTGSGAVTEAEFLQPGHKQAAAGYCIYGPQTMLVLTTGNGVQLFTLSESGSFLLTQNAMRVPEDTAEFAINMSNSRHWAPPVRRYITECLLGKDGVRGKDFNMRWMACMVADVHRVLSRGGIFMYPWDKREPGRPGKLRLMYEANPMAWLIEQAGGAATNGRQPILDIQPTGLHERVSVILGSLNEVARVTAYHGEEKQGV